MKKALISGMVLLLTACNSKDDQFCKCLKAGEELNAYSNKLLTEEVTQEKADKLKVLKDTKKKECADYQTMKGDEMLKRKAECN